MNVFERKEDRTKRDNLPRPFKNAEEETAIFLSLKCLHSTERFLKISYLYKKRQ